jgi:hypothetical protein
LSEVDVQISEDELTLDLLLSPEMKVYSINNHEFVFEKSVSDEEKYAIRTNGEGRWDLYKINNTWILRKAEPGKHDIIGKPRLRKKPLNDDEIHNIIKVMNFSLNKNYFMNEKINFSNKIYKFGLETFQTKYGVIYGNTLPVCIVTKDSDKLTWDGLIWDVNEKKWSYRSGDTKSDIKYVGQAIKPINYRITPIPTTEIKLT